MLPKGLDWVKFLLATFLNSCDPVANMRRRAKTLRQCDFYSKKVLTPTGMKDLYLLIFLHIGTRRVFISPSTYQPDAAWIVEQADAFRQHVASEGLKAGVIMHDRDTKFTKSFDAALKANRSKVRISAFRALNQNAFVERFIQTIQQECLDHFIVCGQPHMNHLCREFLAHYHEERPHHGLDNELIKMPKRKRQEKPANDNSTIHLNEVRCRERLGGLLKSYSRQAA